MGGFLFYNDRNLNLPLIELNNAIPVNTSFPSAVSRSQQPQSWTASFSHYGLFESFDSFLH